MQHLGHDRVAGMFTDANGVASEIANERGDYRLFWTALVAALRGEGPNRSCNRNPLR